MHRVLLAFEPPDGGVPENVAQLALGLAAHGWAAEVAGPAHASTYGALEARGVPVHRLAFNRGYGRPRADARVLLALRRLLADGGFDLVHSHAAKAGVLGRLSAREQRTPSLYSPHCFGFASGLPRPWRAASLAVEGGLGRAGGAILCVCEHERELALRFGIARAEQLHVVYNGCPVPPAELEGDQRLLAMRARGLLVGAVAALREQKHLDLLIEAAPLILGRVPGAGIAIVGNGPLQGQLQRQLGRLGLSDDPRIALLPFTAPAARALSALDVYVLPSAWEAFPIGILEALASGVPQVVTDVGGSREALTPETGILVAPEDPVALADAVVALLADPARRAAASAASRRLHAERFGLARMARETAVVYDAVVEPTRSGG